MALNEAQIKRLNEIAKRKITYVDSQTDVISLTEENLVVLCALCLLDKCSNQSLIKGEDSSDVEDLELFADINVDSQSGELKDKAKAAKNLATEVLNVKEDNISKVTDQVIRKAIALGIIKQEEAAQQARVASPEETGPLYSAVVKKQKPAARQLLKIREYGEYQAIAGHEGKTRNGIFSAFLEKAGSPFQPHAKSMLDNLTEEIAPANRDNITQFVIGEGRKLKMIRERAQNMERPDAVRLNNNEVYSPLSPSSPSTSGVSTGEGSLEPREEEVGDRPLIRGGNGRVALKRRRPASPVSDASYTDPFPQTRLVYEEQPSHTRLRRFLSITSTSTSSSSEGEYETNEGLDRRVSLGARAIHTVAIEVQDDATKFGSRTRKPITSLGNYEQIQASLDEDARTQGAHSLSTTSSTEPYIQAPNQSAFPSDQENAVASTTKQKNFKWFHSFNGLLKKAGPNRELVEIDSDKEQRRAEQKEREAQEKATQKAAKAESKRKAKEDKKLAAKNKKPFFASLFKPSPEKQQAQIKSEAQRALQKYKEVLGYNAVSGTAQMESSDAAQIKETLTLMVNDLKKNKDVSDYQQLVLEWSLQNTQELARAYAEVLREELISPRDYTSVAHLKSVLFGAEVLPALLAMRQQYFVARLSEFSAIYKDYPNAKAPKHAIESLEKDYDKANAKYEKRAGWKRIMGQLLEVNGESEVGSSWGCKISSLQGQFAAAKGIGQQEIERRAREAETAKKLAESSQGSVPMPPAASIGRTYTIGGSTVTSSLSSTASHPAPGLVAGQHSATYIDSGSPASLQAFQQQAGQPKPGDTVATYRTRDGRGLTEVLV